MFKTKNLTTKKIKQDAKNGRQFAVHGPQQKLTNHEDKDKDQKKNYLI